MTDDLAGQIRRNLWAITDHYDAALEPVRRATGSHVTTSKEPPLPVSAHVLDVRAEAHTDLAYWAWFILENIRDINNEHMRSPFNTTRITDQPTLDTLIRFVVIWVGQIVTEFPDDADNLAAEAAKHARALAGIADPVKRDWMPIGECPVTVAVDGTSQPCGAKVRAYPDRAFIACPACGTEDTLAWWMSQIVPEGSDLAPADAVIACVTMRTFRPLTHEQIRQWASRKHIKRHGKDTKGRTLYSTRAVLAWVQDGIEEDEAA